MPSRYAWQAGMGTDQARIRLIPAANPEYTRKE